MFIKERGLDQVDGVCLFMKDDILNFYSVSIVDKSIEDIMWVKLVNKVTLSSTFICVCYLSPEGSSRQVDPHEYFDNLLTQIYIYTRTVVLS